MQNNEEHPDLLATRRSKRSTAGNRMQVALAEIALEDTNKDPEDDNDFVNDKDEEDINVSDFESTDDEADNQAQEQGETEIVTEERRERRAKRSRLEKITAAAHEKHKVTFIPDFQVKPSTPKIKKIPSRVAGDTESRAITDGDQSKRMSRRKHTVLNTSATASRLKETAAKKASQPKKAKIEYKRFTQAELIAQALDLEEDNMIEHRDYLKNEAEKRQRAKVVRATVEGPLLRWISRNEEVKVVVPPPSQPSAPPHVPVSLPPFAPVPPATMESTMSLPSTSSTRRSIYGPPGSLFTPKTYSFSGGNTLVTTIATSSTTPAQSTSRTPTPLTTMFSHYQPNQDAASAFPVWPPLPTAPQLSTPVSNISPPPIPGPVGLPQTSQQQQTDNTPAVTTTDPISESDVPKEPSVAPESEYKLETQTKNYVVHELAQRRSHPKPTWVESMSAMFGDHVKWDEVRVLSGKQRPLARPRQICPITGRQAHYFDRRSGVPYADSQAYKILTQLMNHEYVWEAGLGCYTEYKKPPEHVMDVDNP